MLEKKIDCCGASFETDSISFIGVASLAYPLLILAMILFVPFFPFKYIAPSLYHSFRTLRNALNEVIQKATILPALKCRISSLSYRLLPVLGGFTFKHFNLMVISIVWIFVGLFAIILL